MRIHKHRHAHTNAHRLKSCCTLCNLPFFTPFPVMLMLCSLCCTSCYLPYTFTLHVLTAFALSNFFSLTFTLCFHSLPCGQQPDAACAIYPVCYGLQREQITAIRHRLDPNLVTYGLDKIGPIESYTGQLQVTNTFEFIEAAVPVFCDLTI